MAGKSPRDRPHTFVRDKFCQLHRPVHYASGTWFKFNATCYQAVPDYEIKQAVQHIIDQDRALKIQPTFANLRSIIELIKIKIAVPDRAMDGNHNLLTFADCTLEIDTRQRRLHSHTGYTVTKTCLLQLFRFLTIRKLAQMSGNGFLTR
jgi:hypothetical protein